MTNITPQNRMRDPICAGNMRSIKIAYVLFTVYFFPKRVANKSNAQTRNF